VVKTILRERYKEMITKGHIKVMTIGSIAVLLGWMILMVVFNDYVFYEDAPETEESTVETYFTLDTEDETTEPITTEATPETTAETEPVSVETTAEPTPVETTPIQPKAVEPVQTEPETVYLGTYKLTAYCPCSYCCGKSDGITATGTQATAGRTIAVDPSVIPYGSKVIINGHTYTAEDCGGAINGNRIDVFFNSHAEALVFGMQYADVYLCT
jgi:3D (Asp-Asp-Asp) domain-containing protein